MKSIIEKEIVYFDIQLDVLPKDTMSFVLFKSQLVEHHLLPSHQTKLPSYQFLNLIYYYYYFIYKNRTNSLETIKN